MSNPEMHAQTIETLLQSSMAHLFQLNKRTILVTGAGRGLGLTIAQAILESGGDVIGVDILNEPEPEGWNAAQIIAKTQGGVLEYRKADVTDPDSLDAIVSEVDASFRYPLRGVVAAAGIMIMQDALSYSPKNLERILAVNVSGCLFTAQAAARSFVKNKVDGSIVLVASMSGTVANRGLNASGYNISKSAVVQMARSLASEWSTGEQGCVIRINTLSPGYIKTKMTDALLAQKHAMKKEWISGNMMGRLSYPEEFRGPAVFLLSEGSSYMTGADLRVDGGHCAW